MSTHGTVSSVVTTALAGAGLDPAAVLRLIAAAIDEDLDGGVDVTTTATIDPQAHGIAVLATRSAGVAAGVPVAAAVFEHVTAAEVELLVPDGARLVPGEALLRVSGPLTGLLVAERTALNLLCRLSGIATLTRRWADELDGTGAVVRDTRKTTPTLRALEKYAVRCGGGRNHRMSLSDAALVKDNHVAAAGGVHEAFAAVRSRFPDVPVEVECDTVEQVREVVAAGCDLVLCDNMSLGELRASVAIARERGVRVEASGRLTLDVARAVALTGVDYLAVGALTHSAPVLDIGMDLLTSSTPHGERTV